MVAEILTFFRVTPDWMAPNKPPRVDGGGGGWGAAIDKTRPCAHSHIILMHIPIHFNTHSHIPYHFNAHSHPF